MRISQSIRLKKLPLLGESNFRITIDIENLGNLLNDDWGRIQQIRFPFTSPNVTLDQDLGANGELIYNSFRTISQTVDNKSLWKVQLGASFSF
jgi:hypothetical protein